MCNWCLTSFNVQVIEKKQTSHNFLLNAPISFGSSIMCFIRFQPSGLGI